MIAFKNHATYIKRELLGEMVQLTINHTLVQDIDRLPAKLYPRDKTSLRCCIFKDRAVIRGRILAALGYALEKDDNDEIMLHEYAEAAIKEEKPPQGVLTMIDLACTTCPGGKFQVTNLCRGCVARPCVVNCPRSAISVINGHAEIDTTLCIGCKKCLQLCPYNAINYTPLPCKEVCPVDAIEICEDGTRRINEDLCIYCGKCSKSCPFGAIAERSQIIPVTQKLNQHERPVIALVAPSIRGQFPQNLEKVIGGLKQIGFTDVVDVAAGAEIVAHEEQHELSEKNILSNSCCPAWVRTHQKHLSDSIVPLSDTPSPMAVTGTMVKKEIPNAVTVFIGPCLGKKWEAQQGKAIDYVITFEELGALFLGFQVDTDRCEPEQFLKLKSLPEPGIIGTGFARSGGVGSAITSQNSDDIEIITIDGINPKTIKQLKQVKPSEKKIFIEVMGCCGGCIAGPGTITSHKMGLRRLEKDLNNL